MGNEIMQKFPKRYDYLDNAKSFAMIMIVLGHCNLLSTHETLYSWVSSWHVPIYFIISGILLALKEKRRGNLEYDIVKKLKVYMLPYIVFSVINMIVVGSLKAISDVQSGIVFVKEALLSILAFNGRAACWFLPCLFIAEIVFLFEYKNLSKVIYLVNCFIAVLVVLCPESIYENYIFLRVLIRSIIGLFCISIGYGLTKINLEKYLNTFSMLLLIAIYGILFRLNGRTAIYNLEFGEYEVLYLIEIVLGSLIIIGICKKVVNRNVPFLTWFGKNTIVTLATHQTILEVVWVVDSHTGNFLPILGSWQPFVLCIIMILIEIPVIYTCNRYLYFLFGKNRVLE